VASARVRAVTTTQAVFQHIAGLEALRVRSVADPESRGTAKTLGAGSTAAWLSGVMGSFGILHTDHGRASMTTMGSDADLHNPPPMR